MRTSIMMVAAIAATVATPAFADKRGTCTQGGRPVSCTDTSLQRKSNITFSPCKGQSIGKVIVVGPNKYTCK